MCLKLKVRLQMKLNMWRWGIRAIGQIQVSTLSIDSQWHCFQVLTFQSLDNSKELTTILLVRETP